MDVDSVPQTEPLLYDHHQALIHRMVARSRDDKDFEYTTVASEEQVPNYRKKVWASQHRQYMRADQRSVKKGKWNDRLRRMKSCLTPSSSVMSAHIGPQRDDNVGKYSGFDEWERKHSASTVNSAETNTSTWSGSTAVDSEDMESPNTKTTKSDDILTPAPQQKPPTNDCLSRLNTKLTGLTSNGFSKLSQKPTPEDMAEKAAAKAAKKEERKRRRLEWLGVDPDEGEEAQARRMDEWYVNYYQTGQYSYFGPPQTVDWRVMAALMW